MSGAPFKRSARPARLRACAVALLVSSSAAAMPAATEFDPVAVVEAAKAAAVEIELQGDALVRLAWPAEPTDPRVSAEARAQLVGFGAHAIGALRRGLLSRDRLYSADMIATLLQARLHITEGIDPDYLPALEEAVWFGSVDARRIAIPELARFRFGPALLPIIDAAYEHPALIEVTIRALGQLGTDKSRFFLDEMLRTGSDEQRRLAAQTLARVAGRGTDVLREATFADDPRVRIPAVEALLAVAGLDDLTTLHEYVARRGDDDPGVLERVRLRALQLESLLEQQQEAASEVDPGY